MTSEQGSIPDKEKCFPSSPHPKGHNLDHEFYPFVYSLCKCPVTDNRLRVWWSGVRITIQTRNFYFFWNIQTGCVDHPIYRSMGTGILSRDKPTYAWGWPRSFI